MQFTLLAVLMCLQAKAPTPAVDGTLDRAFPVELTAADPILDGHGPSRRVEYASDFSGMLHVWTTVADDFDTFLRIESEQGQLLVEDDDSGGRPTPHVRVQVEPGRKLAVVVAASKPGQIGKVELHLVAAAETAITREFAEHTKQEVSEIKRLREAKDLNAARTRVEALIESLLGVKGYAESDLLEREAWTVARESSLLALLAPTKRVLIGSLAHCTRTSPDGDPHLQTVRQNLGATMKSLGDLRGAQLLFERVVSVFQRTLPPDHLDLQRARGNLAATLHSQGDLQAARSLEELVLESFSKQLPDDHPDLQRARLGLAGAIKILGDLQGARALEEKVVEVWSRSLPDEHPDLQLARINLASTYQMLGDSGEARTLQEKVLAIDESTLPDDHPSLQTARQNLATSLKALGDLSGARVLEEKVLEVRSLTLPEDDQDLQAAKLNLAATIQALGDVKGALSLEEDVLAVRSRTLPDDNPRLQLVRRNLAVTFAEIELRDRATVSGTGAQQGALPGENSGKVRYRELVEAYVRALRASCAAAIAGSSGREAEERIASMNQDLGHALSFADGLRVFEPDVRLNELAFLLSETSRAAAITSARLTRLTRSDPEYDRLLLRAREASDAFAQLARAGASADEFSNARTTLEAAQRALVKSAAQASAEASSILGADLRALASLLREDEAYVAYRAYPCESVVAGNPPVEQGVDSLCAFVLRGSKASGLARSSSALGPDSEPARQLVRVELGPIEPIEQTVNRWREAVGSGAGRGKGVGTSPSKDPVAAGDSLRALIWDPLAAALAHAHRVIVATDDVLQSVPLDALPMETPTGAKSDALESTVRRQGNDLLGGRFRVELRSSLLELLATDSSPLPSRALVALGDVDFDAAPGEPSGQGKSTTTSGSEGSRSAGEAGVLRGSVWESGFSKLPATRVEVRMIGDTFNQANLGGLNGEGVLLLQGRAASREGLFTLAPKARFLHIATHGWFEPDSIRSCEDPLPLDKLMRFGHRMGNEESAQAMSPMLLCGLALAGANRQADPVGRISGVVTAEELSTLDLSNCELAVLSACDTNVGVRHAGQGVASLERAMHIAGARSVITSLWRVPDEATKDLMIDFYRRIWVDKKPKWQALWEAKMRIRDAKDESGRSKYTPRDWAAWALTGDPN